MMKKLLVLVTVFSLIFALPAMALEDSRLLHVTGNASIFLPADTATLQIGVETSDGDISVAQRKNNILMEQIIENLTKAGIAKEDLLTSNFNVYSYTNDGMTVYNISNMLSVTVRDLTRISALMDEAVKAGANQIYGLNFTSTQMNEAYQKALRRAVEDAKERAAVLADAAGVALGQLISVDASSVYPNVGVTNVYDAEGKGSAAAIISGDVQVDAAVTLTYEIK